MTNGDGLKEEWRPIKGFEGLYEVSNLGRVRSLDRKVWNYTKPGRILKQLDNGHSYVYVSLSKGGRKYRHFYVHRAVAGAFIPNPGGLPEINHKDFNKKNNRVSNLEWVTDEQNKRHYHNSAYYARVCQDLTKKRGFKAYERVLKYRDQIINLKVSGMTTYEIAATLKIGRDFAAMVVKLYEPFIIKRIEDAGRDR